MNTQTEVKKKDMFDGLYYVLNLPVKQWQHLFGICMVLFLCAGPFAMAGGFAGGSSAAAPLILTGSSDVTQLKIISNATQTTVPFQIFQSNGTTNVFSVNNSGQGTFAGNVLSGVGSVFQATSGDTFYATAASANLTIRGNISDGPTAVGVTINNNSALANAAAKLLSVQNNGSEKRATLFNGIESVYGGVATAGQGLSPTRGYGSLLASSATSTNVTTFTPSSDGFYEVGGSVDVTAYTSGNINLTVTWTDVNNTAHSTVPFVNGTSTGTSTNSLAATGFINPLTMGINVKGGTAITIKTSATFVATADFFGFIRQIN